MSLFINKISISREVCVLLNLEGLTVKESKHGHPCIIGLLLNLKAVTTVMLSKKTRYMIMFVKLRSVGSSMTSLSASVLSLAPKQLSAYNHMANLLTFPSLCT